jgi:hypothetical protein
MIDPDGSIQGPWGVKLLDCTVISIYKGAKHFAMREQEWVGGGWGGRCAGGEGRWGGRGAGGRGAGGEGGGALRGRGREEVRMRMLKIREIYTS